jgi:ABC-type transporter Mla subunit MlaD
VARTVKVGLDVDEGPFVRGMGRAAGAAETLDDALDDVADSARDTTASTERAKDSAEDLGDSAKDAGQDLARLRADAERLDRQIDETASSIRDLARAIAATSDEAARADLSKKLSVEQGKLRERVTLRKLVDVDSANDMGAELAGKVSVSFAARLGPMLARAPMAGMNPAVAAIGAPLVAGLVTLLGTAVGGAIIGGVGIGGVIGGVKLAAKDPAVKAAGTELGANLSALMGRASSAFVPETLKAIDTIGDRMLKLEPAFNRAFTSASRHLDPLLDGLLDAAENAMPGVIDAIDAAGPVIEAVAEGARGLGDAIGDGLSQLAPHADEASRALSTLFFLMEGGVRSAFALVDGMSRLYKVAEIVGALMSGDITRFWALATAQDGAKSSSVDLSGVIGELGGKIRGTGQETITAADAAREMKSAFDELFGGAMGYDRAVIAYKDGVKDLNKELRDGKRSLDENTAAGRTNRTAVLDQIGRIKELRDARIEQGESIDVVNGKYQAEIGKIRAKLKELGYEQSEIDELIGKYEAIPGRVSTKVSAETAQAERNLAQVRSLIAQIRSKRVVITTQHNQVVTRSEGRNVPIGDGVGGRRWGGIVEHAQWGTLREAQIAAPVSPARYAWAEPATGGEAFIPRYGDRRRSLDILDRAAAWYGMGITARGASRAAAMGTTSTQVIEHRHVLVIEGTGVVNGLRKEIRLGGGNVQVVLGQGG